MSNLIYTKNSHNQEQIDSHEENNSFPVSRQLLVLGIVLGLIFGLGLNQKYLHNIFSFIPTSSFTEDSNQTDTVLQKIIIEDPFKTLKVKAESALVFDILDKKTLYTKNANTAQPLASVTKLMTTLVVQEIIARNTPIKISGHAIQQEGDNGLLLNGFLLVQNLSDLTLIASSNDGAYALATAAGNILSASSETDTFIEAMNIRASEIGLTKTTFNSVTGLDIDEKESGANGSAWDMALLLDYIVEFAPQILEGTQNQTEKIYDTIGNYYLIENTNSIVEDIPGLIGSKTGYTDIAGGNLVIVYNAGLNHPVAIVVLGSTISGRFDDVKSLIEATDKKLSQR